MLPLLNARLHTIQVFGLLFADKGLRSRTEQAGPELLSLGGDIAPASEFITYDNDEPMSEP
jgi:hypothetical protein